MGRGRSIFARTILLQVELSRAFGLPEASLRALGLEAERLSDPDARVDEETVYAHLEAVAAHLLDGLPRFIVALAEQHETTTLGLPGFAMRTAPTLRDGVGVMHRYQHLTSSLAAFELVELGALARWSEHREGEERLGSLLATEISLLIAPPSAVVRLSLADVRDVGAVAEAALTRGAPGRTYPVGSRPFWLLTLDRAVPFVGAPRSPLPALPDDLPVGVAWERAPSRAATADLGWWTRRAGRTLADTLRALDGRDARTGLS